MASAGNSEPPTDQVQNLLLDDVTGERVSKNELHTAHSDIVKKRQKHREVAARKEAAKAAKAASQPEQSQQASRQTKQQDEAELDPREFFENRSRTIKKFKETNQPNPYPHKFQVKTDMNQFINDYSGLQKGEEKRDIEVAVGARIYGIRSSGNNLIFYEVRSQNVKMQVMCQSNNATGPIPFAQQHEHLRRGDVIGIIGFPGRTNPKSRDTGELSIIAQQVILLTPCLHQLPGEHFGFKDQEQRHRKRYLDLIMNPEVRNTFVIRSKIINYIRRFLGDLDFIEVETPMMNQIAGGATAKPFKTFHNAYNQELYMRIAPELYLKELIVGGMERVFELGKQFRNEDADLTHNPEFTTCEFYMAYADMYDVMEITENMVSGLVHHITGGYTTTFHALDGEVMEVNWAKPWKRIEMIPALEAATGETFPPGDQLHTDETNAFLRRILEKTKVNCPPPLTNARMIDKLVGEFIEETCISPAFIMGHPQMMSPLAKYHREHPGLCERFEAFVCKKEIANAYTELNDPFDQRLRFEEQARQKDQGDDEAQLIDETFCESLEWGLPPTGGWGLGVDRMVMFLTDNYSIREILTFPFMKTIKDKEKPGGAGQRLAAEVAGVEPQPVEDAHNP